ncbi:CinA family nicotinamide mononucleotide deamidase-related protein [candidate division KSB1 bacterium]
MDREATAEIVVIGDEILLGRTLDRNSNYLAQKLAESGLRLLRVTQTGDEIDDIAAALRSAVRRARLVITTGGLGPTDDDRTRDALVAVTGRKLEFRQGLMDEITDWFRARGLNRPPTGGRSQAMVPEGGRYISNTAGTAPGLLIDLDGATILSLPGVPHELRAILDSGGQKLFGSLGAGQAVVHRTIRTTGVPEIKLAGRLNRLVRDHRLTLEPDLSLAYLPHYGAGVDVRITTVGSDKKALEDRVQGAVAIITEAFGSIVYGFDDDDLAEVVGRLALENGRRLAVAESCTGGLIAGRITSVPGSSAWFDSGVVSYSNQAKTALLGVRAGTIEHHGAVSRPVVRAMARGVIKRSRAADLSVAVTGIAGPAGGTDLKPVGLVFMAVWDQGRLLSQKFRFGGDRRVIRERAAQAGLNLLRMAMLSEL